MKTLLTVLIPILVLTSTAAAAESRPAESAPIQQGTSHPFACGDYSGGRVLLVSAEGQVEWEYPAPHCTSLNSRSDIFFCGGSAVDRTVGNLIIA